MKTPVFEQEVQALGSGAFVVSPEVETLSRRLYVAYIFSAAAGGAPAVSAVSGLGLTWTLAGAQCSGQDSLRCEVWYAYGHGTAGTITASYATVADELRIEVQRWADARPDVPIGTVAGYNTNGVSGACSGGVDNNDATGAIVTTIDGSVVVHGTVYDLSGSYSSTPGWTTILGDAAGDTSLCTTTEYLAVGSAGSTAVGSANNLDGSYDWALVAVEILGAADWSDPTAGEALDVVVEIYNPDWTLAAMVDQFDGFKLTEREDGTAAMTMSIPFEDLPADIYATGGLQCPVLVYIRGTQRFGVVGGAGIIVAMDDEDRAAGSIPGDVVVDVHITAITDWQYHLTGREVKGVSGARYSRSTMTPTRAMADLINSNCKTGDVIEPTEYATLGTSGVERDNFGAHSVEGDFAGSHPDTIDRIRWPHGDSLFHSIMEGCRRYDCRVYATWDTAASPKPLMTTYIAYPRAGSDLTSGTGQVRFSRETMSLMSFGRQVDHQAGSNVAEVQGKSVRDKQPKGYAINQDHYDAHGLRETGDLVPDGWQDDVDEEAAFVMAQVGGGGTTYTAKIREIPGQVFGVDWDLGDKVAIDDSRRDITVEDYVVESEWSKSGAGPLNLEVKLGREELSDASRGGRSGGGRSGSGRKGGKPKSKGGEPEAARTIEGNTGEVVFDQADDKWILKGEEGVARLRPVHELVDDPADEDGDEETLLRVEGDVFDPCPSCNGYMWVWAANLGRNVRILISDPGAGGGSAGGDPPG